MDTSVKLVAGGIVTLLSAVIFFTTYFTVDQNEMAVVTRFGELQYVAGPGLHFKMPFVNATEHYRTDIVVAHPPKTVNTYTIDNQEVDVAFSVFYRIPADKVAYIYTNNRDYQSRLLEISVDRLKAMMGQVNVQSVAEKRGELRDRIKAILTNDTKPYGIEITDFQLTELQYTDAFRHAVNNAAVQKANIESVEYQRQQAMKTAEMVKIKAVGEANAVMHGAAEANETMPLSRDDERELLRRIRAGDERVHDSRRGGESLAGGHGDDDRAAGALLAGGEVSSGLFQTESQRRLLPGGDCTENHQSPQCLRRLVQRVIRREPREVNEV